LTNPVFSADRQTDRKPALEGSVARAPVPPGGRAPPPPAALGRKGGGLLSPKGR
jgi:hypothetical protein